MQHLNRQISTLLAMSIWIYKGLISIRKSGSYWLVNKNNIVVFHPSMIISDDAICLILVGSFDDPERT